MKIEGEEYINLENHIHSKNWWDYYEKNKPESEPIVNEDHESLNMIILTFNNIIKSIWKFISSYERQLNERKLSFTEILIKIIEIVRPEHVDSDNDAILLMNFYKQVYDGETARDDLKSYYDNYVSAQKMMNSIETSFQMIATDINRVFWFLMEQNIFEFGSEDVEYIQFSSEDICNPDVRILSNLDFILAFLKGEINILSGEYANDFKLEGSREIVEKIQQMINLIWIFIWGKSNHSERLGE